uniref:Uncharacterized protein n=1 Tax=Acrobeloides nanus TaxID=290746 RepID=A0A914DJH6_9BILA
MLNLIQHRLLLLIILILPSIIVKEKIFLRQSEFCINFASPLTLNSPQYAYWNLTLALTAAPSSRIISMNTSIKIVDEYFGNYSTITFKADNGTLEFISNFNFTCNFCSYGIFYIYDSDNLNNLLYMSEASNLISTSYQHISLNRAITVLYVGNEYNDKTLTGYAVARVLEDNTKNCNLSNLLILSNNLSSLEVFRSNVDGNCIGYLYVPSDVTIDIPLFIYKGSGNVTFSGSHDYESQFPLISLNNDMLNNYAYEFILNKGLYTLDIPPNSTIALNYIINPGSFHTFDDKTYGIISSNGEPVHADIICQGCIANWAPVQIYDFNWLTNDISSLEFDCDGSASSFNGNKSLISPYANMTITFPNNCTKLRLNTDGGVKFFFIYSACKICNSLKN